VELVDIKTKITSALNSVRTKIKLFTLFTGLLNIFFYVCTFVLMCTAAEYFFRFHSWVRVSIAVLFAGAVSYLIIFKIIIPLYSFFFRKDIPDDNTLALKVGNFFPELADRLANSLQVFYNSEKNKYGTSRELACSALITAAHQSDKYDFRKSVSKETLHKAFKYTICSLFITVLFFLFFNKQLSAAFNRLVHPFKAYSFYSGFNLTIFPGNTTIIQGEDVTISVKVDDSYSEDIFLYYQYDNKNSDIIRERLTSPYKKTFSSVRNGFTYFIRAGKLETDHFNINVVFRPLITKLQVKLIPPQYSGYPVEVLPANRGDIECLKGTLAEMSIEGNKPFSEAKVDFKNRKDKDLKVHSNQGFGGFYIWQSDSYFVSVKDSSGLENKNPISYTINIEPDYPPMIQILSPEKSIDLDEEMRIPLVINAADDFGISDLRIGYHVSRGNQQDSYKDKDTYIKLPLDSHEPPEIILDYNWVVDTLNLLPEDIIHYFIEVSDNDRISGSKKSKTSLYSARFPSMAEIFQEVASTQDDQIEKLQEVYEESNKIKNELDEIDRQLKSEGELDWEEKKSVEQLSEQQKNLNQQMKSLSQELENVIDRLKKNQLISSETLEKYEELQKLYQEIDSPELNKMLEELNSIMQDIDPEKLKRSINNFQMAQRNFQKAIEHTISLLKRLKIEQEAESLTKRLQELNRRQEQINQQLSEKDTEDTSNEIQQEEMIQEDTRQVGKDMNELYKDMGELSQMPLTQMKAVLDSMNRDSLSERTEEMISMMKSGKNSQAGQTGQEIRKSMQSISQMMEDVSESLKKLHKSRVTKSLQRSMFNLLQISQEQESLNQTRQKGGITTSKAAVLQTGLMSGLEQVVDSLMALSKETLFITPNIGRALGKAKVNMQKSLQNMSANRKETVSYFQSKVVGGMNQAVMAIEEVMERMQGSGSGMGMDEFLMQMQQMAGEQSRLNRETMDMLDKGSLSLAQQAAMSRLAQQQQAVKEALEKLLKEIGSEENYTGRLDKTLEEMQKVVRDLQEKNVNRETIKRQQKILSRMLDLQHSVRKRDYSNKRLSTTGEEIIRVSPDALRFDKSRLEKQLRRDILRLPEEGYTKEYQKLIRKYYQLLFQERAAIEEEED